MKVYFLSGLGADRRAFQNVRLPKGYEMVHLDWIDHFEEESLESYARRMAAEIDAEQPFMLAGLSFGGIVAIEISKFLPPQKLILISTVAIYKNLPFAYRLAGDLKLYKILPERKSSLIKPFLYWFFGPLDKPGRKLIDAFFEQTQPKHINWALGRISMWRNTEISVPYIHLHGKRDRAFPLRLIKADYVINGGHLCVFMNAAEINDVLSKVLQ
ncbi:alpha/beta fold hydrolase [Desertivirga arenae]|uniref:alpha/beta fold hydrolase n=1 Tax=Desertivirga arenae TaxID=2810309 RepID=UPI001A958798|nr:alpha/beta hydrolase [Pedobacter sp. SYSU D00823]